MQKYLSILLLFLSISLSAQNDLIQSGPMVGYAEMKEVMLWVQTTQAAEVEIEYWVEGSPRTLFSTAKIKTAKNNAFTAHLLADEVEQGKKYEYRVLVNGKEAKRSYPLTFKTPTLWQYRTEPPALKIALGSCAYINEETSDRPGKPYGGDYQIFDAIYQQKPDLMMWLGDNVYLRETDWYSRTGMRYRYTHSRSIPEMQPLLGNSINLAIWDDHDYGPNDSDRSYARKDDVLEVFKDFWANPSYGVNGQGGTTSFYEWNDIQFFMLDDRWFRSPNELKTEERDFLGKQQVDWLIESLVASKATFKFVCVGGQVLNPVQKYEMMANIAPKEREYLLNRIVGEELKNVIFLTGDRHHSEFSMTEIKGIKIYDWTVSPLTSSTHTASDEANTLRVAGSYIGDRNFGIMEVTGTRKERKLNLKLLGSDGKELWKYEIQ